MESIVVRKTFGCSQEQVPIVGQGTWQLEEEDAREAIRALQVGLDLGMTHIDTAESYGKGCVETLVGKAIAGRRSDVFLASKVWPTNASYEGTITACEQSLRRLKTDCLDLYLLHHPSQHLLCETFKAFERLVTDGKIRHWGVSNFQADQLIKALAIAGRGKIACNQLSYHLYERYVEGRIMPLCEANDVALVAYSPFGSGVFPAAGDSETVVLEAVARELGISTRAVALAFLARRPNSFVIPKASREIHVRDNVNGNIALTETQIAKISAAFVHRVGVRTKLGAFADQWKGRV